MRKLLVAIVWAMLYALIPSQASAQTCDYGYSAFNTNSYPYSQILQFYAFTEELDPGCDQVNFASQTEGWIYAYPNEILCFAGTLGGSATSCYNFSNGPESAVAPAAVGCGAGWYGIHRHWAIDPYTQWTQLGSDASVALTAISCHQDQISSQCASYEMWDPQDDQCIPYNTPIVVPLTRSQAYKLTNVTEGVQFDFRGNGLRVQTAWTAPGSRLAFLAIDRNGNGVIDNGTELLGGDTVPGQRDGFDALNSLNQALGGSPDALINSTQPVFEKLLLWEDVNHNGVSESNELTPASSIIADITLGRIETKRRDQHGNLFQFRSSAHVRTAPGINKAKSQKEDMDRQIPLYDIVFASR